MGNLIKTNGMFTVNTSFDINGKKIDSLADFTPEQREKIKKAFGFLKNSLGVKVVEKLPKEAKETYQNNMRNLDNLLEQVDGESVADAPEIVSNKPRPVVVNQTGNLALIAILLALGLYFVLKVVLKLW